MKHIDKSAKEAAEKYELPVERDRAANWQRLEGMLDEPNRRRGGILFWRSAAAVLLIATLFGGAIWWMQSDSPSPMNGEYLASGADGKSIGNTDNSVVRSLPSTTEQQISSELNNQSQEIDGQFQTMFAEKAGKKSGESTKSIQSRYANQQSQTIIANGNGSATVLNRRIISSLAMTSQSSYQWTPSNNGGIAGNTAGTYNIEIDELSNGGGEYVFRSSADTVVLMDPVSQEEYDRIIENPFKPAIAEPQSTFSIDVDAAAYTVMRRDLNYGTLPARNSVRTEEYVNYFSYDYPQPRGKKPFSINTEVGECPWNSQHKLLHIGLQGKEMPKSDLPPANLVFLIDVSGSMSDPNKLPLLKKSFSKLVAEMREEDRVSLVVYAGASGVVLPPTTGDKKQIILDALNRLESGGGTAGEAGINQAYDLAQKHFMPNGNNRVILATDGDFNIGNSTDADLVALIEKKREQGVFLSVLGFGMGNYKDKKMQELADNGNGNHFYIDNENEANKVFVQEFGGTLFTIAKDVKIQLEFNPAIVQSYRLIGYENRLLNNQDFDNDAIDAGELGVGHTVTALYELVPVGTKSNTTETGLKYQERNLSAAAKSGEIVTVKLRYKEPDGNKSKLLTHTVMDANTRLSQTTENFRWSAAVGEYALLLLGSEHKCNASFGQVLDLATSARGADEFGYRREFIQLVEQARDLAQQREAQK